MSKLVFTPSLLGTLVASHSCQWQTPSNWKLVVAAHVWSADPPQAMASISTETSLAGISTCVDVAVWGGIPTSTREVRHFLRVGRVVNCNSV